MGVTLAGGWGYNNLGDDAILAGYLAYLSDRVSFDVLSVDTARTRRTHLDAFRLRHEADRSTPNDLLLVSGGGYLNGSWVPEIYKKAHRLSRQRKNSKRGVAHGIEVRKFDNPVLARSLSGLLRDAPVAVRDRESQQQVAEHTGSHSDVLPDAIALLANSIFKYVTPIPDAKGKVLVNLLDVGRRGDSDEAEFQRDRWSVFALEIVERLGDRALGLIIGDGDYSYMKQFANLSLVEPATVHEFVSLINSADALLTVRMHPGLIGSALNKPVVSLPYCGKVRPTLKRLGVEDQILADLDIDTALEMMLIAVDRSEAWSRAYSETDQWLSRTLGI